MSAISFIIVASATTKWIVFIGVAFTSFSSGLGDPTFLALSTQYDKNVISTWSSGTGAAGVIGSISYAIMRKIGLSSKETLLLMILVPIVELMIYSIVLSEPRSVNLSEAVDREAEPLIGAEVQETREISMKEKLAYIPKLMIYFIPLMMVYFFEYFVNQGLFELVIFKNIFLTKEEQYRAFQISYQLGVFVSRSSVNLVQIKRTWIMSVIQGFIAVYFMFEAIYLFTPNILIIFVIIFIEGLQGGLAYVNTYYRMTQEVPQNYKAYAMNIVAMGDSFGIIAAGFLAIKAHNWICQLPITTNI
jgi:battenin